MPRIEELRRSEQDVKVNTEVQGTTQVRQKTQVKDFIFKKKSDKRKIYFKKRLKIVTAVYTIAIILLSSFAIANVVTLANLEKSVTTNTETIQSAQQQVEILKAES